MLRPEGVITAEPRGHDTDIGQLMTQLTMVRRAPPLSVVTLAIAKEPRSAIAILTRRHPLKQVQLLIILVTVKWVLITPVKTIILSVPHLVSGDALTWPPAATSPISLNRTLLV